MLLSFRFANHRSFRDEQQLNLTPVYHDSQGTAESPPPAVRAVGIFGANASGKSNCLDALRFMRQMAIQSDREVEPGMGLVREPFRLTWDSFNAPSRYVVDLLLRGVRHTYGLTIDNDRVLEEWLYHYPLKKKRKVFERDADTFTWGDESGKRSDLEKIASITAPTALFLSTLARFGNTRMESKEADPHLLHDVYRWFFGIRRGPRPGLLSTNFLHGNWPKRSEDQRVIVDLLRAADVGIVDVQLANAFQEAPTAEPAVNERRPWSTAFDLLKNLARPEPRIQFSHRGADEDVFLDLNDESTGTRQLLALGMEAASALRNGGTMMVDEMDASLHPVLTAKLISLFQNRQTNPHHGQLVFTSHDATLLGAFDGEEILRRDEIWFTEKDDEGASVLYPLSDFKPRKEGENRQRRYLNGNYGALPDISTELFARALAARGDADGGA